MRRKPPAILLKSVLLAAAAGWRAAGRAALTLPLLAGVVLFYQLFGSLGEWAFTGSAAAAVQDIRIRLPGMLAQVFADTRCSGTYLYVINNPET